MGHTRFFYDNAWPLCALTASDEAFGWPVENTQHRWTSRTWRTTGAAAIAWAEGDVSGALPAGLLPQALIVWYANVSAAAVLTLASYNAGHALQWSQGVPLGSNPNALIYAALAPPSAQPVWRLTIDEAAAPSGWAYHDVGKLFLGSCFQPARDFAPGRGRLPQDPTVRKYSEGGQISTVRRQKYQTRNYKFMAVDGPDADLFEAFYEAVGLGGRFWFCEDYREPSPRNFFYCQLNRYEWGHFAGHGRLDIEHREKWDLSIDIETLR